MAESTFSDALSLIGDVKKPSPSEVAAKQQQMQAAQGFSPQAATERFAQQGNQPALNRRREMEFVAENREAGVPLDVETGMDAGTRAKMSFERVPEKQVEWLAKQPGIEGARLGKDGTSVIARVKAKDGTPRDILLDERRTTMKDFADITGDIPQIAVAALAAFFTRGGSLIGQASTQAGIAATTGGAQDVLVRKASGRDVDAGEIAGARGIEAAFDTAIPLVPGGLKRALQGLVGPFAKGVGPLEVAAKEAGKRLNVPLSASQLTGNKALARVERFTENLPFGTPLIEQRKAQDAAVNKVREYLLGGPNEVIPSNQEIAERVGGTLELEKAAAERGITSKRMAGESRSVQSIENLLEENLPGGNISSSQAGAAARAAIVKQRDAFKAKAIEAYGKVHELAGDASFVPTTPIKELVNEIKGSSLEATQRLLPKINRIFGVGETLPDKVTLRQAIEFRSVIGDMIGRPEALEGIPTGYIKRLYGAASEAIDEGVKAAPNPEIGKALGDAQKLYKDDFWKFEQPGVAELFAETAPGKGFKVGDSDVARRLTAGGGNVDQLKVYREMLGPASKEYKGLIRSSLNEMMQDASFGEKYMDAGQFLGRLKGMSPEFRKEAIGPIEKELVGDAKVLELLQGKKIDPLEMERILNARPGKVAETVREIVSEQAELNKTYSTTLMKQLTDGRFDPTKLNADEFVNRFVDNASAAELRQTMTALRVADPEIPDLIRKRATADLLAKAQSEVSPESVVTGEVTNFDYKKLHAFLTGTTGEKYRTLLGADVMDTIGVDVIQTLKDLTVLEASRAKSASLGKQAGQLVYSNVLAAFLDFKYSEIPRIAKNRLIAAMLTKPGMKAWLTSQKKIPSTGPARRLVMSSPPVIRAILSEFSEEPDLAGQVIDAIHNSPDAQMPAPKDARSLIDSWDVNSSEATQTPNAAPTETKADGWDEAVLPSGAKAKIRQKK